MPIPLLRAVVAVLYDRGRARRTTLAAAGRPTANAEPAGSAHHRRGRHPDPGRHRRHRRDRPRHRVGARLPDLAAMFPGQLHTRTARRGGRHPSGRRVRQPDDHVPGGVDGRAGGPGRHARPPSPRSADLRMADACVDGGAGRDRRHHRAHRTAVVDGGHSPAGLDDHGVAGRAAVRQDRRTRRRCAPRPWCRNRCAT